TLCLCLTPDTLRLYPIEIPCQPRQRQPKDEPLRRVEIVPAGSVAVIPLIRMMVIVITLAERDERHQPIVPARVRRRVGLFAPEMADGIDAEGRIEDHEHPGDAGQQEAPEPALPAAVHR